jgi:hypothetical protein
MFGEVCSYIYIYIYIYIYKHDVDSAMFTTLFVVSSVSTSTRGLESSLDVALGSDGRSKEHRRAFYSNTPSFSFAQHLLDEGHPFGPIHEIMQVLHHQSKGPHLNTMEKFYIFAEYTDRSHLNDGTHHLPQQNL